MTSESKMSGTEDEAVIDMAELGARIAARREALGVPELPRNSGEQRTESKRALLAAVEATGGDW